MFLVLRAFQHFANKNPSGAKSSNLVLAMEEAGRSMTLTSACNLVAFLGASTIPVLAVSSFCQACCVVIVLNYVFLVCGFAPLLGIFERSLGKFRAMDSVFNARVLKETGEKIRFYTGVAICSKKGKGLIVLLKVIMIIIAGVGSSKIEVGLSLSDVAQKVRRVMGEERRGKSEREDPIYRLLTRVARRARRRMNSLLRFNLSSLSSPYK